MRFRYFHRLNVHGKVIETCGATRASTPGRNRTCGRFSGKKCWSDPGRRRNCRRLFRTDMSNSFRPNAGKTSSLKMHVSDLAPILSTQRRQEYPPPWSELMGQNRAETTNRRSRIANTQVTWQTRKRSFSDVSQEPASRRVYGTAKPPYRGMGLTRRSECQKRSLDDTSLDQLSF